LLVTLDNKFEPNPPTVLPPASKEYRLYRKAQPIAGEPILQMPRDIAIDISSGPTGTSHTWYRIWPDVSYGNQPLDILFDQTGQVIGTTGRAANRISLWVRDVSLGDPGPDKLPPGDNVLITIYTRSGLIASHPVDDTKLTPGTNWNPFSFTQDGKSSGM
jgi:hypothetical protein